jgi:hypothetical protein
LEDKDMKTCPECGFDTFTELVYEQTEKSGVMIEDNGTINYDNAGNTDFTDTYILDDDRYPRVFICENCKAEYLLKANGVLSANTP